MNILVVNNHQISALPPVRNLVQTLVRNGYKVTVITRDESGVNLEEKNKLKYIIIPEYNKKDGVHKIFSYLKRRRFIRKATKEEMKHNDILWTTTDTTVRELGKMVYQYKHIMQLMELIEDIPMLPGQQLVNAKLIKYAQVAYKVVVPEYNRAHIQKAWWNLRELPTVLPNKMAEIRMKKIPENVEKIIKEMEVENRKIILYQGVFYSDRDIDFFAKAIEENKDQYCLYLMGKETDYKRMLCEKYTNIKNIPYIKPPYHLAITQKASIGILPYVAQKYLHYSILNPLYCAPNKIFEYAAFGVPMIGTDVPGLQMPFKVYDIGVICKDKSVKSVEDALYEIESRYEIMSNNCHKYYQSVDMDAIVKEILG